MWHLRIDPEFKRLIPPSTAAEYDQLRADLIHGDGGRPISAWNNLILDGYDQYEICAHEHIPMQVQALQFDCREAVVIWSCIRQLERRNITSEMRRYLIGKRYKAEIKIPTCDRCPSDRPANAPATGAPQQRDRHGSGPSITLGKEYGLAYQTISIYGRFADAVDRIAARGDGLAKKLLGGEIKVSLRMVNQMSLMPEIEYRRACARITNGRSRKSLSGSFNQGSQRKESVKDMPPYDPDAEMASLSLTVPSWCNSIERVHAQAALVTTSPMARMKLSQALAQLSRTISRMQKLIKEGE